jgi:cobalt-zinc-cadmium efflux system protein
MSLLASYWAIKIGERRPNEKYTFGYKRAEILVAFINASILVGVSLVLLVEAYRRFTSTSGRWESTTSTLSATSRSMTCL